MESKSTPSAPEPLVKLLALSMETQDIPVQILINSPQEDAIGVPYTGVIVRLPKATDTVLTYGLGAGAKHHTIELRFACEVGSIAYKCLDHDAPELDILDILKETNPNLDLKDKIMNVRFRSHPDDPTRHWPVHSRSQLAEHSILRSRQGCELSSSAIA